MIEAAADVFIVAFVCAAAWWDFSTHRIPNTITVAGLAAALILRAPLGIAAIGHGLAGFGLAFGVGILLYALRAIGGGDVKLLAAVGAFLGPAEILGAMACIAVLGAAFALLSVIRRGVLPLLLLNTWDMVRSWRNIAQTGTSQEHRAPAALAIPYGVPIALGTLLWWFGKGVRL